MSQNKTNFAVPLAFVGMMFFAIGFALGINSFLIPVLKGALSLPSGVAYLLLAATFVPFLIFGYPASATIAKIGYKRTMALSFLIFAVAFILFVLSAKLENFILFLIASFVSGAANAYLQASVNPYITILGPIESAAKRMSIMGICNKLAWPVAPLFFALVVADQTNVQTSDLYLPFYIIIGVFLLLGIISLMAPLPEVKAAGEDESDTANCPYAANFYLAISPLGSGCTDLVHLCRCRNFVSKYSRRLRQSVEFGKSRFICLDSEYRYGHRLYLRYYSDSAIPNSRHGNENLCLHRCSRFSGHCIAACRNIYLGNLPDGSRVLANVAGIMAACYGRPRQIHQIRQCSSDNGYRRRSRYPDCFRIFARRFGGTRGLLVSLALFSVYPVLWCSRL